MKSLRETAFASAISVAILSFGLPSASLAQSADMQAGDTAKPVSPKPAKKAKAAAKKPAALNFEKEFGGDSKGKESASSRSVPMDFSYIKTEKPKKYSDESTSPSASGDSPSGFAPSMNSSGQGGGFSPGMKLGF